jgi:hypothetical protein
VSSHLGTPEARDSEEDIHHWSLESGEPLIWGPLDVCQFTCLEVLLVVTTRTPEA